MSNEILVLIGCGSAKNEGKMAAKDKYSSNYFGLKWDYGVEVGDKQLIISAEYGVLHPYEGVDDYDTTVRHMSAEERKRWGDSTGEDLLDIVVDGETEVDEVHVLMGQTYIDPLQSDLNYLEEIAEIDVVYPFEDTSGIGEQMTVIKETIEEAT